MLNDHRMIRLAPALLLLVCAALALPACPGIGVDDGPTIEDVTIDPSTISTSDTGMTDEYFTITIETAGFTEPISGADATIQEAGREAVPGQIDVTGDVVTLREIPKTWFGNLAPGDYFIEIFVYSGDDPATPLESVRQANATQVTVTE